MSGVLAEKRETLELVYSVFIVDFHGVQLDDGAHGDAFVNGRGLMRMLLISLLFCGRFPFVFLSRHLK